MTTENRELGKLQAELARCLTGQAISSDDSQVQKLSKTELDQSRETLIRKRISQTRFLLPRTATWMGPQFGEQFREFADTRHFNGLNAISKEAVAFSDWLVTRKQDNPWLGRLAQWESMDCHWQLGKSSIRFFRFDYDFALSGQPNEAPAKRFQVWCCVRIFSWFRKIRVWPIIIANRK